MVHIEKIEGRRRITEITELVGFEKGRFILNRLMSADSGRLTATGSIMKNSRKLYLKGEQYANLLRHHGFIS